jgi:large subunit ribosomal protein L25
MSHVVALKASPRDLVGKSSHVLAREGQIPAVLYGHGVRTENLVVDRREFEKLMHDAAVGSTLVDLSVEGHAKPVHVIIKEVRHDEVKGSVQHIDFWAVRMTQKMQTSIAITFVGSSEGEKTGGVIMHALRELKVEALPKDLPEHIEADVSPLHVGESLTVADIVAPEGVTLLDDPATVVASVMAPTVMEEVIPTEEAEVTEVPEVGKETEEAEE